VIGAGDDLARAARSLDRRGFLRLAGLAAAAGVLPGGCGGVPEPLAPPAGLSLSALRARDYATFTAAALRVVGPQGAGLIRSRTVDVGRLADELLARSPSVAAALSQALVVLEFGVWPLVDKVRPFTALSGPAQDAVLADLARSRLAVKRALFGGVRSLVLSAFYGAPLTRSLSGYPGPFGVGAITVADAMASPETGSPAPF
jgi:hypothetical protein